MTNCVSIGERPRESTERTPIVQSQNLSIIRGCPASRLAQMVLHLPHEQNRAATAAHFRKSSFFDEQRFRSRTSAHFTPSGNFSRSCRREKAKDSGIIFTIATASSLTPTEGLPMTTRFFFAAALLNLFSAAGCAAQTEPTESDEGPTKTSEDALCRAPRCFGDYGPNGRRTTYAGSCDMVTDEATGKLRCECYCSFL
jgi:hypothetical protein